MRRDFRVRLDFSRIYQDVRQNSWVFVDGTQIFRIHQLADHIEKLFDIDRPFHLLARYEECYCFLPFDEDVRVLENNDTVQIVPGTGIEGNAWPTKKLKKQADHTGVIKSEKLNDKEAIPKTKKSCSSSMVVDNNSDGNTTDANGTFYRTAFPESTFNDSKDSKAPEDNITEDNTELLDNTEDSVVSNKRKRIRKKKKKTVDALPESDTSMTDNKKPKIIDSILISSDKHIRFQDLDDSNVSNNISNVQLEASYSVPHNGLSKHFTNKSFSKSELANLLSLKQSSTPMTFYHKRVNKNYNSEVQKDSDMVVEVSGLENISSGKSNISKSKDHKHSNNNIGINDTVTFKVLKMSEDYSPHVTNTIVGKVLRFDEDASQYTFKIMHGKDQLKAPEGKFALPDVDGEYITDECNDIITLEKSAVLDLTKAPGN